MLQSLKIGALAAVLLTTAVAGVAWWTPRAYEADLATPFAHREAPWAGSASCRSCHPDHHASWQRTFHRTMTQQADRHSVAGAFDGQPVTYQGVTVRPRRQGDDYYFEIDDPQGGNSRLLIERTVGSRRYQQYLARLPDGGDNYYRLPLLWHLEDRRWVHMNGVFLGPDGLDFSTHLVIWDQNCIFCHNTGPVPGIENWQQMIEGQRRGAQIDSARAARYRSSVAELGIACESCHAPADEHARRNRNPLRRYLLHLGGAADPTVVNPARLDPQSSADICGQCHGQRLFTPQAKLVEALHLGPSYRAGERLSSHVEPLRLDSPIPRGVDPDLYRRRFWQDGTPRLTAFEYQGLMQSACFKRGGLTCISCHSMHGGDIRGQIEPAMRGATACASCHPAITADPATHSRHQASGSGSSCYACHLPRMVYGIMEIHRSHRIEIPDPAAAAAAHRPDPCTSCHLDRSRQWAVENTGRLWNSARPTLEPRAGVAATAVESLTALHTGDPVERAVAARLAGRNDSPLGAPSRAFLVPHLLLALTDEYPAVRRFAHHSLRALALELNQSGFDPEWNRQLDNFNFMAPIEQRNHQLRDLASAWASLDKAQLPPPPPGSALQPDHSFRNELIRGWRALGRQRSERIHIGE